MARRAGDTTFSALRRLFATLNDGAVTNVYTVQQVDFAHALRIDPRLPLMAQWHNAALNGGSGSDGSTPKE
ncbi:hypothetical protein [Mycobacterium sp.]|uniref:hypothetical protein n=1 Tax=Mycobacterium sp. TaxID=1785 RepID=UPI003BAF8CAE